MKLKAPASLLLVLMALSACASDKGRTIVIPVTPVSSYAAVRVAETPVTAGTHDIFICEEVQAVAQAASGGRHLSGAMKTRLRFIYVDAHLAPPFGADPELAADLPLSNSTVQQLAAAEADCKRLGFVFAIPALPAQTRQTKPAAAAVWALLIGTVIGPLLVGLGLWSARSGSVRSRADPERDAYIGRMSVVVARVLAIALAGWISGTRLADLMGWRRPATVAMVALVATELVGLYVPAIRRRLVGSARPSASGRHLYLLGMTAVATAPWLIVGLAGAILAGTGPRLGAAAVAAVLYVASLWLLIPWLTVRLLTKPCAPDVDTAVLDLCKRLGQSIRAARLIALKGRPLAYAAVVGPQGSHRYIIVSEDLVQNLSPPLFAATIAHEIGHLAAFKHRWRTGVGATVGLAYVYAYVAFVSGLWPLLVPVVIMVSAGFGSGKQRREFAADAFAVSACDAASTEAMLIRIGEVNGLSLDASTTTYPGATHPHLGARVSAIRAAATQGQDPSDA